MCEVDLEWFAHTATAGTAVGFELWRGEQWIMDLGTDWDPDGSDTFTRIQEIVFANTTVGLWSLVDPNEISGSGIINGTAARDRMEGSDGDDELRGFDAEDQLLGGDGNDVLSGGNGNDIILAGDGDDVINGGAGDDKIDVGGGIAMSSACSSSRTDFSSATACSRSASVRFRFASTFSFWPWSCSSWRWNSSRSR